MNIRPKYPNFENLSLNNTSLPDGFESFKEILKEKKQKVLAHKYYYLNVWSPDCEPCIDEIKILDSLEFTNNSNILCVFVSAYRDEVVADLLKRRKISVNNFIFVNQMINLISGLYSEIELQRQIYPAHFILDEKGTALAYLLGSIHDTRSAQPLVNFFKGLNYERTE